MKHNFQKKIACIFLIITLSIGFMPATAFAGYDDGDTCEYCGGYRFDDWLCDCGPHCSEFADEVDCYLAHHCANCLKACDEDEKCDECEFCSECWGETDQHCVLCGQHDDDVCDNCFTCSSCQLSEGTHCDDCGGCMENLEKCKDHEPELGQENHCGDCAYYCNVCGDCFRGEYEELWCDDCNMCFDCAESEGYHCNLLYCCVPGERCEECEYCNECGVSEGLHCPECEQHVDEWCERGGEGSHCMDCAEAFTCEQCGECTDCAEVEFCEECGVCEDCCRDNAASEGCSCGEYCVLSGDWNEHFCPDCETCFDENEQCEICGYCIECCAAESDCSDGMCIEDADYGDHFCEQCQKCFHDVEMCESCQDAGVMLCTECCGAVTEEMGCGHDYCVNGWQWEEHFCPICQKCYDDCDHEPEAHTHIYNADGNCKVCGMNKDGKPVIYRQPKSVVITPDKIDDTYATFTVEAMGDNLTYQWYYINLSTGKPVAMTDGTAFAYKGTKTKRLMVAVADGMCSLGKPVQIFCVVKNLNGNVTTNTVHFSVEHQYDKFATDKTYHWYSCENCGKIEGKKEHRFGGWEVVRKATTREHGLKERICYECAYVEEGLIPRITSKHEHDYSAAYIQGSDYHWGQCSCGIENKGSMEKHDYGEWVTITKPTVATPGKQMRTCNTCGYEDTQIIGPQGHTHEFYNEEYKKNHKDNGNYGSLIYDGHLVSLYQEPYGKSDKNYHYAYCVVEGCDAYERYSHIWHTEWYDAPTSASDGYYERYCVDCFYHTESKTTAAGKYRIETINGYTNVQTAKPGSKVKITPYNIYPVGQYFDPDYSAVSVNYTWGAGASGTWASVDVEHHKPDSEDTREYWYFIMPDIPKDKASGDVETDYWNFYVEVELEIYDCCNDEETADDRFYEWVGKVDANCGQTGYTGDYKCTLCNYVKIRGEVTPITGEAHGELIQEDSVEGTCTKAGYTGGKICSVCKQLVEPRVYTGRQHNPQRVPGSYIPSTCIKNGQSVQIACADCGVVLKASKPLAKASHDWENIKGTATCTEAGTLDHVKCKSCGKVSLDGGATIVRNTYKLNTGPLGHDYDQWQKVDSTTHQRVCSRDASHIETVAHTWNAGEVTKAATCKAEGVKTYKCTGCGVTKTEAVAKLTTHSYNAATCTTPKTCKVCGATEGSKLGHTYDSGTITTQPTCKAEGVKTYKCTGCGVTKTEPVAKLTTHSYNAATCTTPKTCKVCGATEGSKLGHTYDSGTITTQPTCKAEGVKTYKCTGCGTTKTEAVAKLGHKYSSSYTVDKKATTSADGSKSKHCTRSGCSVKSSVTAIPKIASAKLSYTKANYSGSAKKPTVTVKDSKGNTLVNGTDYSVSYASGRTKVGRYKVTVTYKGKYSGSKVLYFTIVPKAPSSATATLTYYYGQTAGYDDVKFSWSKVTGASGYNVYYKKSTSSSYTYLTRTTNTYIRKKDLTDGVKYNFKVVPYYKSGDTRYTSLSYKTASVYTLKKVATPTVTKSGTKVKVKWTNISGETGYQISRSTSKTGTNIVYTYATTSGTYKTVSATKGKTYYYKVRAYKTVDGKKIYGPWSAAKAYKRT